MKSFFVAVAIATASLSSSAWADIETTPAHLKRGESSATIKGKITGDQTIDDSLRARAGNERYEIPEALVFVG